MAGKQGTRQVALAKLRILPRGFGPIGSFNLALVGSFHPESDRWNRSDELRRPGEKPGDEKLEFMKGVKALESKLSMETVPSRRNHHRSWVRDASSFVPQKSRDKTLCGNLQPAGRPSTWSDGVEVGPPSHVTIRVKSSLIREGAFAAAGGSAVPRRGRTPGW